MSQRISGKVLLTSCVLMSLYACDDSSVPPRTGFGPATTTTTAPTAPNNAATAVAGTKAPPPRVDAGTANAAAGSTASSTSTKPPIVSDSDAGLDDDAGLANATPAGRIGEWQGTTSQLGRTIDFVLTRAGMTELSLTWGGFGCTGDNKTLFMPPVVLGNTFSTTFGLAGETQLTFAGTFDDDSNASGTLVFSTPGAGLLSCGIGSATWTARRQPTSTDDAADAGAQTP